jgi:[ribosomal protein S18]-alanine N-acetyltransferase
VGKTPSYRYMNLMDLDDIMEVERLSFTLPWSREAFYRELTDNPYAYYIVADIDGKAIGYGGVWIVVDEAHITNIAVRPEYRGKKIGETLLKQLQNLAREKGAKTMTLEVRVSNHVAQNLYRKLGFKNGGIRKGYYTDNFEDALVMWVNL